MRSALLLALGLLFFGMGETRAQTSGGPDTFGYHWANNLDPIGSAPVYLWKSIKDTANLVDGLGDDNSSGPIDLGFYFNYYGQWYNTLWIGSNGWVSFQNAGSVSAPFPVIPSPSAPDNIIAGLLSDLTFTDANDSLVPGAAAYLKVISNDSIVIQYDSVPFWDTNSVGYSGRTTFQIILDASDYSITFHYKKLINSSPAYDLLYTGMKIGIEDSTGIDGLQVLDTFPSDSSSIKFYYPGHFSTNDLNPAGLSVSQNFPNPASDLTDIRLSLKKSSFVKISVQDIVGKQTESILLEKTPAGIKTVRLNTRTYLPGTYFYTVSADDFSLTQKMAVIR